MRLLAREIAFFSEKKELLGVFIPKTGRFFFRFCVFNKYRALFKKQPQAKDVFKMKEVMMKELPMEERPRERLKAYGADALSNAELLAIILRTGTKEQSVLNLAKNVLKETDGIIHLADVMINELTEIPGIGPSKAVQILASIELGKRVSQALLVPKEVMPTITTPADCFKMLKTEMNYLKQEHFVVLSLDVKHQVIAKDTISKGVINATLVHPREVFNVAIKRRATAIICAHNHPSGNIEPSLEDIMLTKQLAEAGMMLDIPLFDHVIIGGNDYTSLKAYGHV